MMANIFAGGAFAEALPPPPTRAVDETLRATRVPGELPLATDLDEQHRANFTGVYGGLVRPLQDRIHRMSPSGADVLITATTKAGCTVGILNKVLHEVIPIVKAGAPGAPLPLLVIIVTNTWESSEYTWTVLRALAADTGVHSGLWHGDLDLSRDGPGDMPPNHILVATPGMLKTKFERQELDISQVRTFIVDHADTMLGEVPERIWTRGADGKKVPEYIYKKHLEKGIIAAVKAAAALDQQQFRVVVIAHEILPDNQAELDMLLRPGYQTISDSLRNVKNNHIFFASRQIERDDLGKRVVDYVKTFFAQLFTGPEQRLVIFASSREETDLIHSAMVHYASQHRDVAQGDALEKIGVWHGGHVDRDNPAGLKGRVKSGLGDFQSDATQMIILIATPALANTILHLATKVLIAKTPASFRTGDKLRNFDRIDAVVGLEGIAADVHVFVDTNIDAHLMTQLEETYLSTSSPVPKSLSDLIDDACRKSSNKFKPEQYKGTANKNKSKGNNTWTGNNTGKGNNTWKGNNSWNGKNGGKGKGTVRIAIMAPSGSGPNAVGAQRAFTDAQSGDEAKLVGAEQSGNEVLGREANFMDGDDDFIRTTPVTFSISYSSPDMQPPLYLATDFPSAMAWQPEEMDSSLVDGLHVFTKCFEELPGTYQYKFRHGDNYWFCDEHKPCVEAGNNRNNQIVVVQSVEVEADEFVMSGGLGEEQVADDDVIASSADVPDSAATSSPAGIEKAVSAVSLSDSVKPDNAAASSSAELPEVTPLLRPINGGASPSLGPGPRADGEQTPEGVVDDGQDGMVGEVDTASMDVAWRRDKAAAAAEARAAKQQADRF